MLLELAGLMSLEPGRPDMVEALEFRAEGMRRRQERGKRLFEGMVRRSDVPRHPLSLTCFTVRAELAHDG